MGYKLNEVGWEIMLPIAEKLIKLEQGQSLVLKDSRAGVDQLRYVIYAWLYETGRKPEFKVIRRTHESIEVLRKHVLNPQIVANDRVDSFVTCNLLEVEDENEVTGRIRTAIQRDELTTDEGIRALSEWNRIQGRT